MKRKVCIMESMKSIVAIIAIVIAIVGYIPYIRDCIKGTTKPHVIS